MKFEGELRIFEQVTGQDKYHDVILFYESLFYQLFQSGQGDGGGRLAADSISADFGFRLGYFNFAGLFDGPASGLQHTHCLLPGCRTADTDGSGGGLSLHGNQFLSTVFSNTAQQCISALRSEEHTSELQSRGHLVCRLLLEKKNINQNNLQYI